ncbi:MAG: LAGLIDADG family homing endonuclease [Elusimicrobiota bacterium]
MDKIFTLLQRGWLGAAIDGEGSISHKKKGDRYNIFLYNSDRAFIEKFRQIVGTAGKITASARKKTPQTLGKKMVFETAICNKFEIINILSQLLESGALIIKKDLAKTAIEVMRKKKNYKLKRLGYFTPTLPCPQKTGVAIQLELFN